MSQIKLTAKDSKPKTYKELQAKTPTKVVVTRKVPSSTPLALKDDETINWSHQKLDHLPLEVFHRFPKVTTVNLSHNQLSIIDETFCLSLPYQLVTRLDLSFNELVKLPESIGVLTHLQTLDVACNQLTKLPLTMHSLLKLEWLNLSGNPIVPVLQKVIAPGGDVWTDEKCAMVAANIIHFMTQVKKFADNILAQQNQRLHEAAAGVERFAFLKQNCPEQLTYDDMVQYEENVNTLRNADSNGNIIDEISQEVIDNVRAGTEEDQTMSASCFATNFKPMEVLEKINEGTKYYSGDILIWMTVVVGWWITFIGALAMFVKKSALHNILTILLDSGLNLVYFYNFILWAHGVVQDTLNLITFSYQIFPLFAEKELTYWEAFLDFFGLL